MTILNTTDKRRNTIGTTGVRASITMLGGLAATFELYAQGHTRHDITTAVRLRSVLRVRQGWFSHRDVHPEEIEAARVGGRLTCLSALNLHGAGVLPRHDLHVSVAHNSCRLRMPLNSRARIADVNNPGVTVHWRNSVEHGRLVLPPLAAMSDLIQCQPPDIVSAIAGMLLQNQPGLWPEWREFTAAAPEVHRSWLQRVDEVCESGIEGLLWFKMRDLPFSLRRQVRIPQVGRVDFLIGLKLVIEVDGAEYHTSPETFESDRRRDAVLSGMGYRVLRFSYQQVMFRWTEVETAILAAVSRGDHH